MRQGLGWIAFWLVMFSITVLFMVGVFLFPVYPPAR